MKYVIFPVWARVARTEADWQAVVLGGDGTNEVTIINHKCIIWERLSRSYSVSGGLAEHAREADRLQKEYDESAEPIRVYVYECAAGQRFVPVYAGGRARRGKARQPAAGRRMAGRRAAALPMAGPAGVRGLQALTDGAGAVQEGL